MYALFEHTFSPYAHLFPYRTLFDDYVAVCRAMKNTADSSAPSALFHTPVHEIRRGQTVATNM